MTVISSLSLYITATTYSDLCWNLVYMLSASEIDEIISSIKNLTFTLSSNTSFIMIQPTSHFEYSTVSMGAFFVHDVGGGIIDTSYEYNFLNNNITAAAILSGESLVNVTLVRMFIIDTPTTYQNMDKSDESTLVSSVIVASVERNSSTSIPMNISLYFRVLNGDRPDIGEVYACAFYDLNSGQWNDSGCTRPVYNILLNRYECSCNHLSTFGLITVPDILFCPNPNEIKWINGTCISDAEAQVRYESLHYCICFVLYL